MGKEYRHIHLKYEDGIDTRKALEIASDSVIDGRISGSGVEYREDGEIMVVKECGKYDVLIPQDMNPDKPMLEVDISRRRAIGIEVRRKGE